MMQTHPKKKLEIIIEAPLLNRLLDKLERLNVSGYTVVPAIAGKGSGGAWREGQLTQAGHMVMVICITSEERIPEVLKPVYEVLARHIGIVTVSDVQVIRADHF
jgi:PII-like signaling protein